MILVRCPDCGEQMAPELFPKNKNRPNGLGLYCKACFRVRYTRSYTKKAASEGRTVTPRRVLTEGTAYCPRCRQVQPVERFPRNRSTKSGRGAYCKPCHNANGREAHARRPGGSRSYHLKRRYGITADEYDALVGEQGGVCALCEQRAPQHVDHDHVTGRIRGVLCSCCNQALGNLRDSAATARRAADYLERTTWQRRQVCTGVYRLTSPRPAARRSPSSSGLPLLISSRRAGSCPPA